MADANPTGLSLITNSAVARASLPGLTPAWAREIRASAVKQSGGDTDFADDLEQAGLTAFWRATVRFDESKGPFEHYARRVISRSIRAVVSRAKRRAAREAATASIFYGSLAVERSVSDHPEMNAARNETRTRVRRWTRTFSPKLRQVYTLLYESGFTQREAAKSLAVSQPRVAQYRQQLLDTARRAMRDEGAA